MSSNVSLPIEVYRFLKRTLISKGYNGYFDIDWAGSAGSGREFYRIFVGRNITLVLTLWDSEDSDWDYYLEMSSLPYSTKVVPILFNYNRELGALVQEDAGFRQLKDLFRGVYSYREKKNVLTKVCASLYSFCRTDISQSPLLSGREYDVEHALWESSYFKAHVSSRLPEMKELFDSRWETEVSSLAHRVAALSKGLMHRDFQSENILIKNDEVSFVDIQGARLGPVEYDIASILYDPYIYSAMGDDLRIEMLTHCCFEFGVSLQDIQAAALQRLLQATGAYFNLSYNKGKRRYVRFIKPALVALSEVLEQSVEYPALASLVATVLEKFTKR